jgi:hypothetical protein
MSSFILQVYSSIQLNLGKTLDFKHTLKNDENVFMHVLHGATP